jgi:RNA polymerase sigma-70 factor, ECF subfamily
MRGPDPSPHAARRGIDPETFAAEFTAASASLWTVAAGVLGHRNHAEDVLQEAAVIGLQKRATFTPGTSFVAWMARIVRFCAQNQRRRLRRRRTETWASDLIDASRASPPTIQRADAIDVHLETDASVDAFSDQVLLALQDLKPVARTCLLLKVVADREYREIATLLGIPEGTAMSHVSRARAALAQRLASPIRSRR